MIPQPVKDTFNRLKKTGKGMYPTEIQKQSLLHVQLLKQMG